MEKKKVLATILSACMLTSMVGMTACGGEGGNGGNGNNNADYVYNVPSESKMTIKIKNMKSPWHLSTVSYIF